MPKFDRLPSADPRSAAFPIRMVVAEDLGFRSFTWALGLGTPLDQGREGACVGFGWTHELIARPKAHPTLDAAYALGLYRQAKTLDEWPGEDYDGTSVLAGAKAAQARGYMGSYYWASGLDDVRRAIGHSGPVVFGLNWYTGMMDTDADGFIHPTGQVEGGHCVMANRVAERDRYVSGPNSWGAWDGRNGGYWKLSFDDVERLMAEGGEACLPVDRRLVRP